jgi:hypothetical protein
MRSELPRTPGIVRILQEVSTAQSPQEVENVLWDHRDYIASIPCDIRELFLDAIKETAGELNWSGS